MQLIQDTGQHTYTFRYYIENGNFTEKDLEGKNFGACDSLILHSITYSEQEGRKEDILTMDGKTGSKLSDYELFQSWIHLAGVLSKSKTLDPEYKNFAFQAAKLSALIEERNNDMKPSKLYTV